MQDGGEAFHFQRTQSIGAPSTLEECPFKLSVSGCAIEWDTIRVPELGTNAGEKMVMMMINDSVHQKNP